MKKLLFTLVLLFSLHSFGQGGVSNPVSANYIFLSENIKYNPEAEDDVFENAVIVPEGKFWVINDSYGSFFFALPDQTVHTGYQQIGGALPENFKLYSYGNTENEFNISVYEHNLITETSLSSTNVELPNQIRLFPNPTTSEVALNSDKQYEIEVYDMAGNKIMELTGNTIDMSHLSSAIYIVKAFDKIEQEHLSYKVIKH